MAYGTYAGHRVYLDFELQLLRTPEGRAQDGFDADGQKFEDHLFFFLYLKRELLLISSPYGVIGDDDD